jgi:hypothetical protein
MRSIFSLKFWALTVLTLIYVWIYSTTNLTYGTLYSKHEKVPFWTSSNSAYSDDKSYDSILGVHLHHENIRNIRLVGERHSGTSFLTRYLKECFPSQSVGDFFLNHKHWFQPTPEYVVQSSKRYGKFGLSPTLLNNLDAKTWWQVGNSEEPKNEFNDTLVIAIFRNPYDWIEAMRLRPHHWSNHVKLFPKAESTLSSLNYTKQKEGGLRRRRLRLHVTNITRYHQMQEKRLRRLGGSILQKSYVTSELFEWQDFVDRPMHVVDYDEKDAGILCQFGFSYGRVSPCGKDHTYVPEEIRNIPRSFLRKLPFEADEVVYELNTNGEPFENPMQLRAAKISNFLNLKNEWNLGGFVAMRYEDTLGDNSTGAAFLDNIVGQIAEAIKVESECPKLTIFQKEPYTISEGFVSWIINHADWRVEKHLGYSTSET